MRLFIVASDYEAKQHSFWLFVTLVGHHRSTGLEFSRPVRPDQKKRLETSQSVDKFTYTSVTLVTLHNPHKPLPPTLPLPRKQAARNHNDKLHRK